VGLIRLLYLPYQNPGGVGGGFNRAIISTLPKPRRGRGWGVIMRIL